MKLRFEVDQAECFRRGIDCPKSIVTIEVNPADIDAPQRALVADRLDGIDVCELDKDGDKLYRSRRNASLSETLQYDDKQIPAHIVAKGQTFEALMEAILENQAAVEKARSSHQRKANKGRAV